MGISKKLIKGEITKAEKELEFCWDVLVRLKKIEKSSDNIAVGIITFQDKLANLILTLNKLRTQIIAEEKDMIGKKRNYQQKWFTARLRTLASYKRGIDLVVHIGKALGDAYAYFFYRNDLQMLEEHLSHQRIVNSAAGIGEIGETEFLKNVKHVEGNFTLYHGITNILRYGDYSFVDLKKHKVVQVGELKTKRISDNQLEFSLTLLEHKKVKRSNADFGTHIDKLQQGNSRKDRQINGLIHFLKNAKQTDSTQFNLTNKVYVEEIEKLYKATKANKVECRQVSSGLAFAIFRLRKTELYRKIYFRRASLIVESMSAEIIERATQLMKFNSTENSLILGQVLYNSDFTDKNTPGTVPIFWYPFEPALLKKLYFLEIGITAIFNPIHLITEIENLGFAVKSRYIKQNDERRKGKKHYVERFDLFISYIINFLMTESFVVDSLKEVLKNEQELKGKRIVLKPQQRMT